MMFLRVLATYAIWGWLWCQAVWLLIIAPAPIALLWSDVMTPSVARGILIIGATIWGVVSVAFWMAVGIPGDVNPWSFVRSAQERVIDDYRQRAEAIRIEDAKREAQAGDISAVEVERD